MHLKTLNRLSGSWVDSSTFFIPYGCMVSQEIFHSFILSTGIDTIKSDVNDAGN